MAFRDEKRSLGFWVLALFFAVYVLFLYGPTITIVTLSFQGPTGGLTFPMNGVSFHWFVRLFEKQNVGDFAGSIRRSLILGVVVMALTVTISIAAGLAYRKNFKGGTPLFYLTMASLIIPSILISLGIGIMFSQLHWATTWFTSALGAHLTWTLPFGLLIMFAVFNRFNPSYEEAGRDLGATAWQNLQHVVLPIIAPSVFGIALFGFTLSYDEFPRSYLTSGTFNTLPLEIMGMTTSATTPVLYALGTVTTAISMTVIALCLGTAFAIQRRRLARGGGSDAGKGV
ncbi:MAG TPA: ABC transporter permease [Magnetospirillaceae bacterium]